MKIYLDDERNPTPTWGNEWVIVRRVKDVQTLLLAGLVDQLSLDHDLGENEPTGYDLCKWMAEHNIWPQVACTIHSANPVGMQNMKATIDRYFYGKEF